MGAERSSTTRQVQPPRPPNAWILYRSDKIKQLPPLQPGEPRRAQSDVSKMISRMWREESDLVKAEYEKRADVKKAEHQAKYPNYRFQPMKKSDKEKLREQSKEKDPPKKSRRGAPYPVTAPAPAPSQYSYSYPEQNAPSPPLSAASSTPSSPNPLPPLYLDPELSHVPAMSRQVSSSASSAGVATPSFVGYMLPPSTSQAPSPSWSHPAYNTWDSSAQPSPVTWPPQLPEAQEDLQPVEGPSFISLDMPPLPQNDGWNTQDSSADFMQALLSATGDPSIFQVSFDPTILNNEPPEGFDLSYAPIEDPTISNSWLQPLDQGFSQYSQQAPPQPQPQEQQQLRVVSDEITPQQHAEMLQYLNFNFQAPADDPYAPGPSSRHSSGSHSAATAPPDTAPPTPSYVPPTGAFVAGRRVVAGSWKPPVNRDEDEDALSIQHQTQWGLRAVS